MRAIVTAIALSFSFTGFSIAVAAADEPVTAAPALSSMAPADEYFGRHQESVLEIRNRLDALDSQSTGMTLDPGVRGELDDLTDAICDWQQKYPGDPWLPRSMRRLLLDYQRAGAASSPGALHIVALLQSNYDDTDTAVALSEVFAPAANAPEQTQQAVSVHGTVVDADSGEPIAGAVVIVTPGDTNTDLNDAPSVTTGDDGSFVVADLPATTLSVTVRPPAESGYEPYSFTVDGSAGDVDAGVIQLEFEE